MKLTEQQMKRLREVTASADLKTVFFVTLLNERKIEKRWDDMIRAIEENNCAALADFIYRPSLRAQEQAVNVYRQLPYGNQEAVLSVKNRKGNTALHLMSEGGVLEILGCWQTCNQRAALSAVNKRGQTPLDLMREEMRRKVEMRYLPERIPPKRENIDPTPVRVSYSRIVWGVLSRRVDFRIHRR